MSRCSICEWDQKLVACTGPQQCDTLAIGSKPGREEAFRGSAFCGDTGEEINRLYLPLAGLDRPNVRMTNVLRCWLGGNNNEPTERQIEACATHHLPIEVERCGSQYIFLLGSVACSLIPSIELDKDHGLPMWFDSEESGLQRFFGAWKGWVWPMYHPAGGMRNTSLMIPLLADFERFRLWRTGRWELPNAADLEKDYREIESTGEMLDTLESSPYLGSWLPADTENDGPNPWSLQYSTGPGKGYFIRARRKDLIERFARSVLPEFCGLLLHYANHDLNVMERMHAYLSPPKIRDTMQEAYQQGDLPQGLKALAWRLLGIRMRSWEDVVLPYSRAKMIQWLSGAWGEANDRRTSEQVMFAKPLRKLDGKRAAAVENPVWNEDRSAILGRVEWKPTMAERDLKRILGHSHKLKYDVWKKVKEIGMGAVREEWREKTEGEEGAEDSDRRELSSEEAEDKRQTKEYLEIVEAVRAQCGQAPVPSIAHAPFDEALAYACADSDIEGRVGDILEKRAKGLMEAEFRIPEEDFDR